MPISVQNDQENSYEKFKKFLNNPITKFSLSMAGGTALVGLIAKLIYDKTHQNKIYTEPVIDDDVTLSVADQIWIAKNMILFAQKYPLCWHNTFMQFLVCPDMQFLVCPDIRCESYNSDDLMVMINWINEKLSKKYTNNALNRKEKVPMYIRRAPNLSSRFKNSKNPNECLKKMESCPSLFSYIFLNSCNFSGKSVIDFFNSGCVQIVNNNTIEDLETRINDCKEFFEDENGKKSNRLVLEYNRLPERNKEHKIIKEYPPFFNNKNIFFMSKYGYYPTFISISDTVIYKSEHHIHGCYIVYDEKKNPKFFIWADGIKSGLEILSVQESLEKLKKFEIIDVVYSNSEIIEKYYIPELMYNAN